MVSNQINAPAIIQPEMEAVSQSISEYAEELRKWEDAATELRKVQGELGEVRRRLEYREAELTLDPWIDGKNTETRKAQLTQLCANDEAYQLDLTTVEAMKTRVQRLQDEALAARDRMTLNRRIIDWGIAYVRFLGNEGGETSNGHD